MPGFTNFTGTMLADMLRLNASIPPASKPNILGVLGGDLAGYPNGRRVFDDVVTIELRAIAGVTYPLVDKSFKPDAAASAVTDGVTPANVKAPYPEQLPLPRGRLRRVLQPVLIPARPGAGGGLSVRPAHPSPRPPWPLQSARTGGLPS